MNLLLVASVVRKNFATNTLQNDLTDDPEHISQNAQNPIQLAWFVKAETPKEQSLSIVNI